jgi:hypothetical protein
MYNIIDLTVKSLLALPAVFLGSKSHSTHNHIRILLSDDSGSLETHFFLPLIESESDLSESESEVLYDWQFTANQFVLAPSLLRLLTRVFF